MPNGPACPTVILPLPGPRQTCRKRACSGACHWCNLALHSQPHRDNYPTNFYYHRETISVEDTHSSVTGCPTPSVPPCHAYPVPCPSFLPSSSCSLFLSHPRPSSVTQFTTRSPACQISLPCSWDSSYTVAREPPATQPASHRPLQSPGELTLSGANASCTCSLSDSPGVGPLQPRAQGPPLSSFLTTSLYPADGVNLLLQEVRETNSAPAAGSPRICRQLRQLQGPEEGGDPSNQPRKQTEQLTRSRVSADQATQRHSNHPGSNHGRGCGPGGDARCAGRPAREQGGLLLPTSMSPLAPFIALSLGLIRGTGTGDRESQCVLFTEGIRGMPSGCYMVSSPT